MRILHIISTLNIGNGIANAVMNYYRKIDRDEIQFDFLVFSEPAKTFTQEVQEMGGRVFEIPAPTLKTASDYANEVQRFFRDHAGEWSWVHIHEILVQRYVIKAARLVGGMKIIMHSHVSEFVLPNSTISPFKNKIQMLIKKIRNMYLLFGFKRKTDLFLACSKEAGIALFGKRGIKDKRFYVLNNCIDVEKYAMDEKIREQYREELGLVDKKVLLNIGRLCEQKNQDFLIEVFDKVYRRDKDYRLLLVGSGAMENVLRKKAKTYALEDKILFLGNRTDIPALCMAADLFVFPSIMEGLGIALVEAQASGLNCIASSTIPDCAKVTPYVNFLGLKDGVEVWANQIISTLLDRNDGNAIVGKSEYNIDTNIKKLVSLYNVERV